MAKACPGMDVVRQANCLSDLLYLSPPSWHDTVMLKRRNYDGTWQELTRIAVQHWVLRVAAWLQDQGIKPGDRVGVLGHNSVEWLLADFAILRIGAVTVPAYFTDPPEAVAYVFNDAGCRLVLSEPGEQMLKLKDLDMPVTPFRGNDGDSLESISRDVGWDGRLEAAAPTRGTLATMIYTSGTTGNPKGVMLSHGNLLADVQAGLGAVPVYPEDVFLSFLPVSHAFERTVGHFLAVASGAAIAYADDVTTLMRDMPEVKPTVMISVPRLYEKIYAGVQEKMSRGPAVKRWLFAKAQALGAERFALAQEGRQLAGGKAMAWNILDHIVNAKLREKMGGRLRLFVSGGAALNPAIARFLLAADITVLPGYGLTEASPVLAVNVEGKIKPDTVGPALPGVQLRLGEDGELLASGDMIMQGYWNRPEDTAAVLDDDGWLHTGDIAEIDADGYVKIVDRKKEIIVMSNGENVPPAVVEQCLTHDPCILQAMVVGDDRPFLSALVVPDEEHLMHAWRHDWQGDLPADWRVSPEVHSWLLERMRKHCRTLASFMHVSDFAFVDEEWTQENGFLTPTLKLKRRNILAMHAEDIAKLYAAE